MTHNYASKAFILNDKEELLVVKRASDDKYRPGEWEFPGGKIDGEESPQEALIREVKEEAGLDVEILNPLNIVTFHMTETHKATIMVFICKPLNNDVVLSHEHDDFKWVSLEEGKNSLNEYLVEDINLYEKYFKK